MSEPRPSERGNAPATEKNRPATSDVAGTSILLVVGLVAVGMGLNYGFFREDGRIDAGFMPVVTGAFIALASALELVRMYVAPQSSVEGSFMEVVEKVEKEAQQAVGAADPGEGEIPAIAAKGQRQGAVFIVFAGMGVTILAIQFIGLLLSLGLMVLAILTLVERKPVLRSVIVASVTLLVLWLVFSLGLNVPLPRGSLGIL